MREAGGMRPGWHGVAGSESRFAKTCKGTEKTLLGKRCFALPLPPTRKTANGRERVSGAEGAPGAFVADG